MPGVSPILIIIDPTPIFLAHLLYITGSLQVVLALLHANFLVFVLRNVRAEGAFFKTIILNRFMHWLIPIQKFILNSKVLILVDGYDGRVVVVALLVFGVGHVVGTVSRIFRRL